MRFVLEFAVIGLVVFAFFAMFRTIYSFWLRRRERNKEKEDQMWRDLRSALGENSRHRLEDILILHSQSLPKEVKPVIQSRIDDLIIKESDEKIENSIQQDLNK